MDPPQVVAGLDVTRIRSRTELEGARGRSELERRYELLLNEGLRGRERWTVPGICLVCRQAVDFWGDWLYSEGEVVNFRERLACPNCGLNNRQRFVGLSPAGAPTTRRRLDDDLPA